MLSLECDDVYPAMDSTMSKLMLYGDSKDTGGLIDTDSAEIASANISSSTPALGVSKITTVVHSGSVLLQGVSIDFEHVVFFNIS